ncbi:MAG: pyrophosphate--fructose-6-phosphate 1-phosphotransferase [Verrucomicrobia bacterium]|nr:pyrophosphate--fructose-6-phosphate 1-phosphotransferase [Verrucomicrobiota bacterium]
MRPKKVAFLTAGGLAPCLNAALGGLITRYTEVAPEIELLCYRAGYKGLLLGESIVVTAKERAAAQILVRHGGSAIGNSRVKLTNVKDCLKRGLIKEGQDPLKVAADQLVRDGVDVLHTIGGDDTNTTAADLAAYLAKNNYQLTVIGLPKTIDNDVVPIRQSLGAYTAADQGAVFFDHVVAEYGANPRMLIIHEVMGRNCGWLTAATAREYLRRLDRAEFVPGLGLSREHIAIHGLYIPELALDVAAEAQRLRAIMDRLGNINLFISEGAGVESIVAEMTARGQEVPRDAFGHVKLDAINPGKWFGDQFAKMIGAEKVLVQKSGYFSRAAPANIADVALIRDCVHHAIECALRRESGVVGHDEERGDALRAIEFARIKGGKPFDVSVGWFRQMLAGIGQPAGAAARPAAH